MRIITFILAIIVALPLGKSRAGDASRIVPDLPALSSDGDRPFIVDGVYRVAASDGFAFRFATDGERQLCVIFDPHDGTPVYLSDGQETLLYDLSGNRIVRVPTSRANVFVDWNEKEDRPLVFQLGVDFNTDSTKLSKTKSYFRVDRFVAASKAALKPLESVKGTLLLAARRDGGSIGAVQFPDGNLSWFRFTSCAKDENYYTMDMTARLGHVPQSALKFPDLTALRRDVSVVDLDEHLMPNFVLFLKNGYASLAKLAIAGGPEIQKNADKVLLSPNWNELRKRDEKLGETYRRALSKQGIEYRAVSADAPSTEPSR